MEINVNGIKLKDKDIKNCFLNIITRLTPYCYAKSITDLYAIEQALDNVLNIDENMKGKIKL